MSDLLDYDPQKNGLTFLFQNMHKSGASDDAFRLHFLDDWVGQTFKQMRKAGGKGALHFPAKPAA